jgi:hypothetical protein
VMTGSMVMMLRRLGMVLRRVQMVLGSLVLVGHGVFLLAREEVESSLV